MASATLAEAGVEYNRVRLVIVRPATDTLKDTTLAFTPTSRELTLELSVAAIPSEALIAAIEFKQDNTVIFSGSANVKAIAPTAAGTATPIEIEVDYTGPGASAKTVAIQPGAGTYSATNTTQFTAKAFDGTTEVPNTPIFWSVSDESKATISSTGVLTPKGQRGTVAITATAANGVFKTIEVQLAPTATGLRVVQGAGQRGTPGSTLPLPVIIELVAADGLPAATAGQTITFAASGNAQILPASSTLDANGRAQATMKVGTAAGTTYIFTATVGAQTVSWAGTASVGAPTHFVPSGSTTLTLKAGVRPDTVPTLRVADAAENSVPGLFLKISISKNDTLRTSFNFPADSIGLLEVYRVAPEIAGTYSVLIEADPQYNVPPITYTITIVPGPAAKLAFQVQPSNVAVNQLVAPAVKVAVQDQFGNLVTSATGTVAISVDPATGAGVSQVGTGSETVSGGFAVFSNLKFNVAKTGIKVWAKGLSGLEVLSTAFNITP